jgi:predicted phosphodiesterase
VRRIALISDIHGNRPALDAVLADIGSRGVEDRYCLGDLVGYGPDPEGVVERISALDIPTVRGNYDRGVGGLLGDCGCYYASEQAKADGALSYEFTSGALSNHARAWLYNLPDERRFEHLGVRVLLTHGSPRKINEYLMPDRPKEQLVRLAREAEADAVCVGHVHVAYHRRFDTPEGPVHYLNSGSVGKPKDGDPRAAWLEVVLGTREEVQRGALGDPAKGPAGTAGGAGPDGAWIGALIHRVAYDVEPVAKAMIAAGLPQTLADALRNGGSEPSS